MIPFSEIIEWEQSSAGRLLREGILTPRHSTDRRQTEPYFALLHRSVAFIATGAAGRTLVIDNFPPRGSYERAITAASRAGTLTVSWRPWIATPCRPQISSAVLKLPASADKLTVTV